MSAAGAAGTDVVDVLQALLRGHPQAAAAVANTLRVDAYGLSTFGRTDALDLFAAHPLALSATPHVLSSGQALALLEETPEGRAIGVFADLADGVIARVWVVAATAADAQAEPAVPLARDDFLSQLRESCLGDPDDHPDLHPGAWRDVLALGSDALTEAGEPRAASSSQAVVMRAFSDGAQTAALYHLRVHEHAAPRRAHRRLALATARRDAAGKLVHSRLAVSDALPEPAPVSFSPP